MKYWFDYIIERDEGPYDVQVEGIWHKGWKGNHTDPPEADWFELLMVTQGDILVPFDLTEEEETAIIEWAFDNPPEYD